VVGVGAALFDMLSYCNTFPQEDTKMCSEATVLQGGGPCSTALVAACKLGISCGYAGVTSNDFFGDYIRHDFERYGVDVTDLKVKDGYQSAHSMVICSKEHASRTCVWNPGNVPEPESGWFDFPVLFNGTRILHLDGNHADLAFAAAAYMHAHGGIVSMDAGTMRPGVKKLLTVTDIMIASEEFAEKLTESPTAEQAALSLSHIYHPLVVAVTCGKKGGVLVHGQKCLPYPAFPVDAVDTNGAGDVFHGAFLVGWLHGFSTYDCCVFASAVSALKCKVRGAREGVPSYQRVVEFLAEKKISIHKG
jgi:sugar/nucleoside kinase (ribokinase family)